jgi:hypothetical protein
MVQIFYFLFKKSTKTQETTMCQTYCILEKPEVVVFHHESNNIKFSITVQMITMLINIRYLKTDLGGRMFACFIMNSDNKTNFKKKILNLSHVDGKSDKSIDAVR